MKPKVSVLMPTYNINEDYLREAISSILNQTFRDFELLICDDASTKILPDKVIESFSDSRIKLFKNEVNLGISENTNKLIRLAEGEYLAQMDADDIAMPERLEKTVKFLDEHPEISYVGGTMEYFPVYRFYGTKAEPTFLDCLQESPFCHSTLLYRKSAVIKYDLFYDKNYVAAMDYELWSRVFRHVKCANLPDVLLKYRWHENNTSKSKLDRQRDEYVQIRKNIIDFLTNDARLAKKIRNLCDTKKLSFGERIFYIRNQGNLKIINILGLKFKIKRF